MPPPVRIRRARPDDIRAIISVEQESFPDPWDEQVLGETLAYFPTTFFVAVQGSSAVGFIAGGLEDTGEAIYGHIANLAVARSARRNRIGRALVEREEQEFALEMASGVQLEVRASNRAAIIFYLRMGYRQAFVIPGYYSNGEDAIMMMKAFHPYRGPPRPSF
jgi:ribosomal-protein-alanine N-acetyltransferase